MKHVNLRLSRCYHVEELYGEYFDCPAPYHDGDCSKACGGFLFCEICLGEIAPMAQYALVGGKGAPICADCVIEFGRDGLCELFSACHDAQSSRYICNLIRAMLAPNKQRRNPALIQQRIGRAGLSGHIGHALCFSPFHGGSIAVALMYQFHREMDAD